MKKKIKCSIAIIMVISLFLACGKSEAEIIQVPETEDMPEVVTEDIPEEVQEQPESLWVYICGAVANPGVYKMESGSRIYQVIEKAGGLTEDADVRAVNQAEVVSDGQQITIYSVEESIQVENIPAGESDGKININTADKSGLMEIPGIGETRANAILEYRQTVGAFQNIEELMNVSGIKEGTYEKIKEYITV